MDTFTVRGSTYRLIGGVLQELVRGRWLNTGKCFPERRGGMGRARAFLKDVWRRNDTAECWFHLREEWRLAEEVDFDKEWRELLALEAEYEAHCQAMADAFVASLEPCEPMDREELFEEQASAQIEKRARAEEYYTWVDSQVVDLDEDEVRELASETPTSGGV